MRKHPSPKANQIVVPFRVCPLTSLSLSSPTTPVYRYRHRAYPFLPYVPSNAPKIYSVTTRVPRPRSMLMRSQKIWDFHWGVTSAASSRVCNEKQGKGRENKSNGKEKMRN